MQEDAPQQPEEKVAAASLIERKGSAKAKVDHGSDDEGSVVGPPTSKRTRVCAICETKQAPKWYHCPEGLVETGNKPSPCVMCEDCGIRWRHCESLAEPWRGGSGADPPSHALDGIQYPPEDKIKARDEAADAKDKVTVRRLVCSRRRSAGADPPSLARRPARPPRPPTAPRHQKRGSRRRRSTRTTSPACSARGSSRGCSSRSAIAACLPCTSVGRLCSPSALLGADLSSV